MSETFVERGSQRLFGGLGGLGGRSRDDCIWLAGVPRRNNDTSVATDARSGDARGGAILLERQPTDGPRARPFEPHNRVFFAGEGGRNW